MGIKVYISSVSSNMEIKTKQGKIENILNKEYKGQAVEYVDIAVSEEDKNSMRELMGDPKGLPPQIFNGDEYCGDFDAFDNAVEDGCLPTFLKI